MSPALRSDPALVRRFRAGDDAAFTAIVQRYEPQLMRFATRLLGDAGQAEDVVQDALLRAYLALRRDQRAILLSPWLHTVLRNCAIDVRRRPAHVALTAEPDARTTTLEAVEARARMDDLLGALQRLPASQREPLVLHVLDGRPYAEIAEGRDLSVAAVKALISRARTQLRSDELRRAA